MRAEREALLASAQGAVELARAEGVQDVFASLSRSRSVEMERRDGKLEKVTEATSRSLSLSIWVEGRYSSSSTTDLRPDRLKRFVADAVALTRALQPDADRQITDPALFAHRAEANLDLVDPAVLSLTREDRSALLEAIAAELEGQDGVISATSAVSTGHTLRVAASSNGFQGQHETTSLWLGGVATLQDESGRPEGYMGGGARHREDAPDPSWVGREALAQARARLGTTKGPTVKATMIVEPRAAGRLIGALLSPASGSVVQQGRSFWAEMLGQPAVSPILSVTDDPLVPRGLGSRPFDDEGITARTLPILEGGKLAHYYLDTTYARKLGMPATTGSPSNRVVGLGERDLAAILAGVGSGVLVTSWLGGNMDSTTGDFSYGMRGHLVENGQIGAPVGEMNVTGNLLELFSRLAEVGNDPWPYSALRAPTLVFEDVQFSGA